MARKNSRLDAIRAQAKHEHRLTGQKVSKLHRQGNDIKGAGLDPRVSASELNSMNSRQLQSYRNRLAQFRSRETQFVPGKGGQPIRRSTWNEIKNLEAQHNAQVEQYESQYGGIVVPGAGRTARSRAEDVTPINKFRAGGQSKTFVKSNRPASGLNGQEGAEEILAKLRNQVKPGYLNKRMRTQRDNLEQMLTQSGDQDVLAKIRKLTNAQLVVLVDETPFLKATSGRYLQVKTFNAEDKPRPEDAWIYSEFADNRKRLDELIDWAGTLPKNGVANRDTRKSKEYTDTTARPIPIQGGEYKNTNAGVFPRQFNPRDTNAGPIPVQKPKRKRKPRGK